MHLKHQFSSWLRRRGLLVLAYLLVAAAYLPGIWTNSRHEGDEATWIAGSKYLELYLSSPYKAYQWEQDLWRKNQSPVTLFVTGLGRRLGGYTTQDLNRPWNNKIGVAANEAAGRRPSDRLVAWARAPMALLAVLAICLAHQVVSVAAGELAGLLWLVLAVTSSYLRVNLVRAMCEAPLVASCVAGLALFNWGLTRVAYHNAGPRFALLVTLCFGMVTGLAVSSKLNGLAIVGAGVFLVGLLAATLGARVQRRALFVVAGLALLVIGTAIPWLALNPYLWPAPVERAISLFDTRLGTMALQTSYQSHTAITTLSQHLTIVPLRVLQTCAAISHKHDWPSVLFINLALLVPGIVTLVQEAFGTLRRRPIKPAALGILLVGGAASLPPLFTPLDWPRYYILPVFFSTMLIAIGIAWLGQRLHAVATDKAGA